MGSRWWWIAGGALLALLMLGGGAVVLATTAETRANEKKWAPLIAQTEAKYGIPRGLLHALIFEESKFKTAVINGTQPSSVGALGIAQFMPATAKGFGVDPLDPNQAIPAAGKYVRQNYDLLHDWRLAVAAYNAGENLIKRLGHVPKNGQTDVYVAEIFKNAGIA